MAEEYSDLVILFPAHAGMNRGLPAGKKPVLAVPRTRGDEPASFGAP